MAIIWPPSGGSPSSTPHTRRCRALLPSACRSGMCPLAPSPTLLWLNLTSIHLQGGGGGGGVCMGLSWLVGCSRCVKFRLSILCSAKLFWGGSHALFPKPFRCHTPITHPPRAPLRGCEQTRLLHHCEDQGLLCQCKEKGPSRSSSLTGTRCQTVRVGGGLGWCVGPLGWVRCYKALFPCAFMGLLLA